MDETQKKMQEIDDAVVQSAALVHRRRHPAVSQQEGRGRDMLLSMLAAPDGRYHGEPQKGVHVVVSDDNAELFR
ncbi:signal transduction histidine kinase [Deinococcus sp. SL84]|uniref:signal transduction histidine kinase n=1 Tax=Deinococcus sp. SL84 TaxID=2994663 RepID=UPI002274A5A1|nr:signal transduction histidine kinase [Deinococcus sp. SL84]MCY1703855.1 signal transduction histidine kinase [Deinococcus sp. SL84]